MLYSKHFNEFVLMYAWYLFVSDTLSTQTITTIMEPSWVECKDPLISHRSMCASLE